ncbi:RICIN domain-containing protein [Streptomyces sp. NPDC058145]|uniref:RICIN domain-containing protein n=1 Tax=Streptomyces sp. NPDC058145 TaxID=3346356 RepID=UPI0036E5619E
MPRPGRSGLVARIILLVTAAAVIAGLTVRPDLAGLTDRNDATPVGDSYDGYDTKAAEQLRGDQCVAADALRRGGPNMFALAQNSIGLPPDQLHQKLDRDLYNTSTPLHQAYDADETGSDQWVKKADEQEQAWSGPVSGLRSYPGAPQGQDKIFDQVGLLPWLYQSYFKSIDLFSPFYEPSPTADDSTKAAALAIGDPLYATGGTPSEQQAWALWKKNSGKIEPNQLFVPRVFADDARIFLSSGGFAGTAPEPDTPEFRIAVEDLKARFAACAWHDPIDPNRVLGKEVAQASAEWQQEIASQATQRQQILAAGATSTKALQEGAFALGKMLGQSWIADYATRWLDYYTEGGISWIGDGQLEIQVPGAAGKCLDVQGGKKDNGTPVQVYTCNGGASQKWQLMGSYPGGYTLVNPNSFKCLEVLNGNSADGTKIQIRDCGSSKAQQWKFDVRSAGPLRNAATGKCLHLPTFDNSKDAVLSTCNGSAAQKLKIVPKSHTGTAASKADVDKAKVAIKGAQTEAKKQLGVVKAQLASAQKAATASDTAMQTAYGIADANGAPRGRGLLVGQQKDQVTKGSVAALQALVKAGETAEAATRASAGDSATIAQRALAQAAQSKAEFRKEAAKTAEWQAKAAADAAKIHRDNAKKDKETAEAKLAVAVKAEGDAKAAAADAHAKRLAAEAEEKTAKAEKENAAAKRAEAADHRKNAENQATKAKDAKDKAEAAEKTAEGKRDGAVKASDHAKDMRDDAWDAEQKAAAARAKADAKDAYADSLDSGDAATAARAAANDADKAADDAEAAATKARSEADAATKAAAGADAAATRAEAAAKRARSDADAAQADKLKADAAVRTATSAVADAIKASQDAAAEAKTAVKLADEAEQHAKDAKTQADAADKEAGKALAASAKAAGFAHVTAQAAVDAGKAAEQVTDPANDAIQLGSPYVDTDSAASLVVLTGQASKTIAEQQQAVADAHAKNARQEAAAAKDIADQAKGDAKEAYQHAANAAQYASDARTYSKEALGYAADAAKAAAAASASLARTVEYDKQATEDAAAADKAAGKAEGYAKDARDSADAAELDAAAARSAATQAEQDAKDARTAADRADAAATEAEEAAKDAEKYATEAQNAADRTERARNSKRISDGGISGIGSVFWDEKIEPIGKPEVLDKKNCEPFHVGNCIITAKIHFNVKLDIYLCTLEELPMTGCPAWETLFLNTQIIPDQYDTVERTISMVEFNESIDPVEIVLHDFIGCGEKLTGNGGSWGDCAWATFDIASLFAGKAIKAVADAIKAVDAALRTGIGIEDAFRALRTLDKVNPATLANISRTVEAYQQDIQVACEAATMPRVASGAATRSWVAAASGPPCRFWKLTDFQGQRVYQRDDLIKPDYVSPDDPYGRTNLKRMQQGFAPMGTGRTASGGKDKPLNLHHMLQTQDGPIAEVTDAMHFDNYGKLHWKSGTKIPSGIDRPEFERWKKEYWKSRAKDFQ